MLVHLHQTQSATWSICHSACFLQWLHHISSHLANHGDTAQKSGSPEDSNRFQRRKTTSHWPATQPPNHPAIALSRCPHGASRWRSSRSSDLPALGPTWRAPARSPRLNESEVPKIIKYGSHPGGGAKDIKMLSDTLGFGFCLLFFRE